MLYYSRSMNSFPLWKELFGSNDAHDAHYRRASRQLDTIIIKRNLENERQFSEIGIWHEGIFLCHNILLLCFLQKTKPLVRGFACCPLLVSRYRSNHKCVVLSLYSYFSLQCLSLVTAGVKLKQKYNQTAPFMGELANAIDLSALRCTDGPIRLFQISFVFASNSFSYAPFPLASATSFTYPAFLTHSRFPFSLNISAPLPFPMSSSHFSFPLSPWNFCFLLPHTPFPFPPFLFPSSHPPILSYPFSHTLSFCTFPHSSLSPFHTAAQAIGFCRCQPQPFWGAVLAPTCFGAQPPWRGAAPVIGRSGAQLPCRSALSTISRSGAQPWHSSASWWTL